MNNLLILLYAPAICWFGYISSTLLLERAYLVAVVLAYIAHASRGRLALRLTPAHWFIILWFLWVVITAIFAISPELALRKVFAVASRLLVATIILSMIYRANSYAMLAWSFVLAGAGGGLFCFVFPGAATDEGGRLFGTVQNANTFGVQITAAIASSMYLITSVKRYKQILIPLLVLLTIFFISLIIGSGSRKAVIGVMVVLLLFGTTWAAKVAEKSIAKASMLVLTGVVAMIVVGVLTLQSTHGDRFLRLYEGYFLGKEERIEDSEAHRLKMYERGWEIAMENPVIGIGLDNFRIADIGDLAGSFGTYAHSNYIELMVGVGIVGAILYYIPWLCVTYAAFSRQNKRRFEPKISLILLIIMCVYDLAAVSYYSKVSWVIYALILAGVYGTNYRKEQYMAIQGR